MQGIQQLADTPVRDGVVGQRGEDFGKHDLHVGESSRERGAGPKGIVAAENAFGVLAALVITVVVEAEFLTANGGRAAKESMGLAMVAGGIGQGCLQNLGYQPSAISSQLKAAVS